MRNILKVDHKLKLYLWETQGSKVWANMDDSTYTVHVMVGDEVTIKLTPELITRDRVLRHIRATSSPRSGLVSEIQGTVSRVTSEFITVEFWDGQTCEFDIQGCYPSLQQLGPLFIKIVNKTLPEKLESELIPEVEPVIEERNLFYEGMVKFIKDNYKQAKIDSFKKPTEYALLRLEPILKELESIETVLEVTTSLISKNDRIYEKKVHPITKQVSTDYFTSFYAMFMHLYKNLTQNDNTSQKD